MQKLTQVLATCLALLVITHVAMLQYTRIKTDPVNVKYMTASEAKKELNCLVQNVYFESAGEDFAGKVAVAQVTINRANNPEFANSICEAVYKKAQFSWTLEKPKALVKRDTKAYNESYEVAKTVLFEGFRLHSVKDALYYHTTAIKPYWADSFTKVAVIGSHVFYKKNG